MQPIKNIIFDLGGVVMELDFGRTEAAFVNLGITNFKELFAYAHATTIFKDYEIGLISDEEFIQALQKLAGNNISALQITDAWNALLGQFPSPRIELIRKLSDRYRIFLFSNTNAIHLEAFQKIYTNEYESRLDDLFEKTYYSHIIKLRKPDVSAFEHVIRDAGVDPSTTLFIDDYAANVEGAKAAGLQTIFLQPGKTLLDLEL
jgi:HAD superfamily hydrolase (TIGR01509 family)